MFQLITDFYIPREPLSHFVRHLFYYKGADASHSLERFLPDGQVQMIINLKDDTQYIYDNTTLVKTQACRRVWFSGFRTEPITIPSGQDSEMIIVFFKKGKARSFVNCPMDDVSNEVVDAELLLTDKVLEIRSRVINEPSVTQKFWLLEKYLTKYYLNQPVSSPFVDFALDQLQYRSNIESMKTIAAKTGFSQKHVIKLFKEHVGVVPKSFLKITRFQQAITAIEQGAFNSWSAVAYDCGYYDQSHFIADFKSFSGFTPVEYLSRKGQTLNYVPVG